MGLEVMERLRFLASLPLAGTAQTEGGGTSIAPYHISLLCLSISSHFEFAIFQLLFGNHISPLSVPLIWKVDIKYPTS